MIVPQIGMRIKRNRGEEYDDRLTKSVCRVDSNVQRRIIDSALSTLHPVNNARAVGSRMTSAANRYAGVGRYLVQIIHGRVVSIVRPTRAGALSPKCTTRSSNSNASKASPLFLWEKISPHSGLHRQFE